MKYNHLKWHLTNINFFSKKNLLARYGELWIIPDSLEQKFLLGLGSQTDKLIYQDILAEIAEIRNKFRF